MSISNLKILLLVLFSFTSIFSQEDFITGQLLDNINSEPVVFATIRLKNKAIGVISNLDGSFRIPEKLKELGADLEISSLGYETKNIQLIELATNKTNIIRLNPAIEILDEVVVEGVREALEKSKTEKKMSAFRIVKKAIENIHINYPNTAFTTIGYYRDFQMENAHYHNLNEALFEVWDQGFEKRDLESTKVRIFEYKRNLDFPIDSIAQKPYEYKNRGKTIPGAILDNYGGNEFTILRIHDAIRNNAINAYDYVNVFKTDFLENHYFKKEDEVILNNKRLYKISFRKNTARIIIKGNLFISRENFAIYKLEYAMYSNHNKRVRKRKRTKRQRQKEILLEIIVGYTPIDGLMYPNYHSMKNTFIVKEPPKFIMNVNYSLGRKIFIISFNNNANEKDVLIKSNYKLEFNGKRIKINRIVHIEDEVLLYPNPKIAEALFEEISKVTRTKTLGKDLINIKIEDIRDIHGNYINEPFYREVKQYREFFVQRIITSPEVMPNDGLFMNKNAPVFKDQPVVRPNNISDYWMNSPLPNIEE